MHPSQKTIQQEWQRRRLERFVQAAWPLVVPAPFVMGMHITLLCDVLERLARGEVRRVIINIPPRFGKTLLGSVLFPAWLWLCDPTTRFLTASYSLDLATRDSLAMRRLVETHWYQDLAQGGVRLVDDQATKTRFENTRGGARLAASVGGSVTGEGGDVIILDDPQKIELAHSAAAREAAIDWYGSTLATRRNEPATARMLVIAQRLHEHDLPGHLLTLGDWTHVCLPAEYDPHHPHLYPDDPRREAGELLWPEQWPRAELDALKRDLGSARTASMLQQLPAPATGEIFKRSAWRYYQPNEPLPRFDAILQSWDLAFTDTASSDYVVGQAWGTLGADRYLLHQTRDRLSATATLTAIRDMTQWIGQRFPDHSYHQILIEQAANGAGLADILRHEIPGIRLVIPQGDKINRAHSAYVQIESGNVYLPGAPNHDHTGCDQTQTPHWVQHLIEETAVFPRGTNDDQVDALTQALNHAPNHHHLLHISSPADLPIRLPRASSQMTRSILDNPRWRTSYRDHHQRRPR